MLWPRGNERGSPEQPVVLLDVQMQGKPGFKHRLCAQTARFAQLHRQVQHLEVLVVVPHRRLKLGPAQLPRHLQALLADVHWRGLKELCQRPELDSMIDLLTLPVLPKPEISGATF